MTSAIKLSEKFELFSDHWTPKIVASANGQLVKLATFKGEVVWHAHAGEVCNVPSNGPVSLIILSSGTKVQTYARALKGTVVRQDAKTVIFLDGRVITADVEAAGRLLNDLGWGGRSINVMASFPSARARPRRG